MPSLVGHALGGLIAGGLAIGKAKPLRHRGGSNGLVRGVPAHAGRRRTAAIFAILGALPDIDFLFGTHSTYTHSLGATALVFAITLATGRGRNVGFALAAALAYGSHLLLDWLGNDTTPPIGIMALWPLTSEFYESDLHWFMAISRRYWLPGFWTYNLRAVMWELLILGPIAALVWWIRLRSASRAP